MAENPILAVLTTLVTNHQKGIKKRKKQRKKMQATIIKYVKNQRKFIITMLSAINAAVEREFWVEPTRGHGYFWEHTISSWTEDRLWIANFRMKKSTFYFICEQLSPALKRRHTRFRMSIPVEKRVAICLWHLATGEDLRSLGWRFDVAKSTSCEIINDVCQAIVKILLPKFITWPTGNALRAVVDGFASEWNFPQCAGAIDGTHIPITAPPDNPAYYYNRKRFYSIVLQAVVDHSYRYAYCISLQDITLF